MCSTVIRLGYAALRILRNIMNMWFSGPGTMASALWLEGKAYGATGFSSCG